MKLIITKMPKAFFQAFLLFASTVAAVLVFPDKSLYAQEKKTFINKLVAGYDEVEHNTHQLFEVQVENQDIADRKIHVKLSVESSTGETVFEDRQNATVKGFTIHNLIFSMKVRKDLYGFFVVRAYLYDSKQNKLLDSTNREGMVSFVTEGYTGKRPSLAEIQRIYQTISGEGKGIEKATKNSSKLNFGEEINQPELIVKNVEFLKRTVIRGEQLSVRFDIKNEGGAIARNVEFEVYILIEFKLKNKPSRPMHQSTANILAPGETKNILIPFFLEETDLLGKYYAVVVVDPADKLREINEENNQVRSKDFFNFTDIRLLNPESEVSLDITQGITFNWESEKFNMFYIQISPVQDFTDPDLILRIPKGNLIAQKSLSTISGEELISLNNLNKLNTDKFFWRVIGFDDNRRQSISHVEAFYISKK